MIFTPLTFHWYAGAFPPLTDMAENVTEVPAHTIVAEAVIVMLTGSSGFTVMVAVLEMAGFPVGQVASEVSLQVIASLLTGVNE
jgi:hypothetical protein